MAQIKNPEDGNQRGKVTILGYSERFFMNATPPVHIMKDLLEIGEVEKNGKIEIDIDKESRIVFKCNQCSCRFSPIVVKPGDWVVLIYNRGVDSMLPIITDEANHIRVREEYHESERRESKKFFLRMLMIVLILCGVAGGIYGGIHAKQVRDRKARLARILEDRSLFNIENPNAYTIEELERMQFGENLLPFELRNKMEKNGDLSGLISSPRANEYNDQWKKFAGVTYRASELVGNVSQNYSFGYSDSGVGKYVIFGTIPGTHVVTDKVEFNIYKVTSDADHLYLYYTEQSTPIKVLIKGHSLYTNNGAQRYEKWQ